MDGHDTEDTRQGPADLTAFQNKFQTMSNSIVSKIDGMGSRINELEQSISEVRAEMGVEGLPSPSVPTREKTPLSGLNLKEENS